jgi:hypothetical protein
LFLAGDAILHTTLVGVQVNHQPKHGCPHSYSMCTSNVTGEGNEYGVQLPDCIQPALVGTTGKCQTPCNLMLRCSTWSWLS